MSIHVACKCGKHFKVKEHLAGKAVRCPECKSPLRVPEDGAAPSKPSVAKPAGKSAKPGSDDGPNVVAALARYEEAQKRKQKSLEDEAAYKSEQNKLIESYDQLTGRGKTEADKKAEAEGKKKRPTEELPKKRTLVVKIADAFGAVMSNLFVKYVLIATVLGGGVYGSVKLVQFLTHGVERQIAPQMRKEDRVRMLLKEVRDDVDEKRWREADEKLKEIAELDPKLTQINRDYKRCREETDKALGPAKP
ncbi:hypothetical protein RAS2_20790 [Phycisphaerae bacterium RAS2]|nr:hypothetical protein RAS2_20790 [Phycisphaerae bacterium RAS2]